MCQAQNWARAQACAIIGNFFEPEDIHPLCDTLFVGSLGSNRVWPDVWLDGGFQHLCFQPQRLAHEKEQRDGAGVGRFETPWEKNKGGAFEYHFGRHTLLWTATRAPHLAHNNMYSHKAEVWIMNLCERFWRA